MTWAEQIYDARKQAEHITGQKLSDDTFKGILYYTISKALSTNHTLLYVPVLLVDEIRDHFARLIINTSGGTAHV